MSRARLLHEAFFSDVKVCSVSHSARLLFLAAIVAADDATGVFPARPSLMRARAFPEDDMNSEAVAGFISELEKSGLIGVFQVGDEKYGVVYGFCRHQNIQNPRLSKYPAPPAEMADKCKEGKQIKKEAEKRKPTAAEIELIEEFRKAYTTYADPLYKGFKLGIYPPTEVRAARSLLADQRWERDRISAVIAWVVRDKVQERGRGGRTWYGWSAVVRSVNKLCTRFVDLETREREGGKGSRFGGSAAPSYAPKRQQDMTPDEIAEVQAVALEQQLRDAQVPEEEIAVEVKKYRTQLGLES